MCFTDTGLIGKKIEVIADTLIAIKVGPFIAQQTAFYG